MLEKVQKEGFDISMEQAIANMLKHGIRLSSTVIKIALSEASE